MGSFLDILSIFMMSICIQTKPRILPILGIFPVQVKQPSFISTTFLPLSFTGKRLFFDSMAKSIACFWLGPINYPPRSRTQLFRTIDFVLPPRQSLASRTVTLRLGFLVNRSLAADKPDSPAPIITTLVFGDYSYISKMKVFIYQAKKI